MKVLKVLGAVALAWVLVQVFARCVWSVYRAVLYAQ